MAAANVRKRNCHSLVNCDLAPRQDTPAGREDHYDLLAGHVENVGAKIPS